MMSSMRKSVINDKIKKFDSKYSLAKKCGETVTIHFDSLARLPHCDNSSLSSMTGRLSVEPVVTALICFSSSHVAHWWGIRNNNRKVIVSHFADITSLCDDHENNILSNNNA